MGVCFVCKKCLDSDGVGHARETGGEAQRGRRRLWHNDSQPLTLYERESLMGRTGRVFGMLRLLEPWKVCSLVGQDDI